MSLLNIILVKYKSHKIVIGNGKELRTFIDNLLKPHGFIRMKDTWYLNTDECICFLVVSKSIYGGRFESGVGCFYKKVFKGEELYPVYYKSNLRYGIDDLVGGHIGDDIVKKAFSFRHQDFTGQQREEIVANLIENYVILFLLLITTGDGIKKAVKKYRSLKNRIDGETLEALSIR
jgi:hypothetical protein